MPDLDRHGVDVEVHAGAGKPAQFDPNGLTGRRHHGENAALQTLAPRHSAAPPPIVAVTTDHKRTALLTMGTALVLTFATSALAMDADPVGPA